MPTLDLTEEERAEVVQTIRAAIDGDRYPLSVRGKRLSKPSFLYAKLRGVRRRR